METKKKSYLYSRFVSENQVDELADVLTKITYAKKEIVIVCIGTDRSTGDALGPLIGTHIEGKLAKNVHVYGTLDEPVHGMNLPDIMNHVHTQHKGALIIGIDSCLGVSSSRVGMVNVCDEPLKPGAGVKRDDLPEVGDYHITGVVNVGGYMEYFVLQNTRLSFVMSISRLIGDAILKVFSKENASLNDGMDSIEFVSKDREQMLINTGWEKKLNEFTKVPISDVYKDGIRGNQMWERWDGENKQELYIMYSEDKSHICTLYDGTSQGVEFNLRNLKSSLKKHARITV